MDVQAEVNTWRSTLAAFAAAEGLTVGPLFTDVRGREESGLYRLVEFLRTGETAAVVVVPDVGHLTHVGCLTGADQATAQRFLRARVLTLE
jgi:FixJ family two-component response regulator